MAFSQDEVDSEYLKLEAARRQAERDYNIDKNNAGALTRWGGSMLELAQYKQGDESVRYIEQAISKLQEALKIDPARHEAEWCLGNAFTSLGFLCPDKSKAQEQFGKAAACFKRCQQRDPSNEMYRKAIEMCDKAPDYYDEIQSQLAASGMRPGRESGGREEAGGGSDFWWDLAGWALLGTAIVGAMVLTRTAAKPA